MSRVNGFLLVLLFGLLASATCKAQRTVSAKAGSATEAAIFLSDIHFDPFYDPGKITRLDAAPAAEWAAILAAPESPQRAEAEANLKHACATRGDDTSAVLWNSTLHAVASQAGLTHPRFVTISGDLMAHAFDCKYKTLVPSATHAQYVTFVGKTIRYVMSTLEAAVPSTPVYLALGNNDSACTDYQLAPEHDPLLQLAAGVAAETLPEPERAGVETSFRANGSYAVPLAGVPDARIVVLDDLYESAHFADCGGARDTTAADAQIDWLRKQLQQAREQHQRVWVLAHIPPGIDLYTTARKLTNVCGGGAPVMMLSSNKLAQTLGDYADVIRLALFGHTHEDEIKSIAAQGAAAGADAKAVPVKLTASISPINGNLSTFTVAKVDTASAELKDFTVFQASNKSAAATWTREYTWSATFHQPAFYAASVASLIESLQADKSAETPAAKAYVHDYFPGDDASSLLRLVWPEYACSMDHMTAEGFTACVCQNTAQPAAAPSAR